MKTHLLSLMLITILVFTAITGCHQIASAGSAAAQGAESVADALIRPVETASAAAAAASQPAAPALTFEEAQNIALKHAGFTANQVTALHTEYEVKHGTPQYDVEFHQGNWEYDYEIQGNTGEILSFSKDD